MKLSVPSGFCQAKKNKKRGERKRKKRKKNKGEKTVCTEPGANHSRELRARGAREENFFSVIIEFHHFLKRSHIATVKVGKRKNFPAARAHSVNCHNRW